MINIITTFGKCTLQDLNQYIQHIISLWMQKRMFQQYLTPQLKIIYSKRLGQGSFGKVFEGEYKINTSTTMKVAIKVLERIKKQDLQSSYKQIHLMKSVIHQNILKLYGDLYIDGNLYFILQLCKNSLQAQIKQKKLSQWKIFVYLRQIKNGMMIMNKQGCMHRDLKPDNVLLDQNYVIKICDFGISKKVQKDQKINLHTAKIGSPLYIAPNVYGSNQLNPTKALYTNKCDVFSIGAMIYYMLTGQQVYNITFKNSNILHLAQDMQNLKNKKCLQLFGEHFHPFFKQFIENTVTYEESTRWSFQQMDQYIENNFYQVKKDLFYKQLKKGQESALAREFHDLRIGPQKPSKIKIVEQQKTSKHYQPNSNLELMQTKIINDKRFIMIDTVKVYLNYIHSRAQMFINVSKRLQEYRDQQNLSECERSVFSLLCQKIFQFFLVQLMTHLNSEYISFPDQQLFCLAEISKDKACLKKYQIMKESYKYQIQCFHTESQKKSDSLTKYILENTTYKQVKLHTHFKDQLSIILTYQDKEMRREYQSYLAKFMRKIYNYNIHDIRNNERKLRLYWNMLKVTILENTFPITDFRNYSLFINFQDDYKDKPIKQIIQDIYSFECCLQQFDQE